MNTFAHTLKSNSLKGITFLLISLICIYKVYELPSYPTGDAGEYVLITEAFYRHKTPDIRYSDARSFKAEFIKHNSWDKAYKPYVFDDFQNFLLKPGKEFAKDGDSFGGLYVAKNGKVYGYHFYAYSLFNVPARYLMSVLNQNPLSAFKITNAFLVILTLFLILFYSSFNSITTCLFALAFYFSSAYWYLWWIHPEVFTICLVTMSTWLFFQNRHYFSLLLMAIAVTQNQPLIFILVVFAFETVRQKGFTFPIIIKAALCCLVITIPPLFYYYHFETFSIINKAGYLDGEFRTFNRILGFYFDLDQGMILAIPLIFILYIFIIGRKFYIGIKRRDIPFTDIYFFLAILAISYTVSGMVVWNHGQSVINRYATWTSGLILVHTFFLLRDLSNKFALVCAISITLSQILVAFYHEKISNNEVSCFEHKPIAKWVINNYPEFYNPDPLIFGIRTLHDFKIDGETSPIIYHNKKYSISKIMCLADSLDALRQLGLSQSEINKIQLEKNALNGWIYINRKDLNANLLPGNLYNSARYITAKKLIIPRIKSNIEWFNLVKGKAGTRNLSVDSILVEEALYFLNLQEQNDNQY